MFDQFKIMGKYILNSPVTISQKVFGWIITKTSATYKNENFIIKRYEKALENTATPNYDHDKINDAYFTRNFIQLFYTQELLERDFQALKNESFYYFKKEKNDLILKYREKSLNLAKYKEILEGNHTKFIESKQLDESILLTKQEDTYKKYAEERQQKN